MTVFLKAAAVALALMIAGLLSPASAQQPAPGAVKGTDINPPAASVALAKEILTLKDTAGIYTGAVAGLVGQAKETFLKDNLDKQKDLEEVAAKVAKDLAGRENEVGDAMAKLYASLFTEQELRDLVNFYKSPLGKKVIANEPRAMEQTMVFIDAWAQAFSTEIVGRFRDEMKKRGKTI